MPVIVSAGFPGAYTPPPPYTYATFDPVNKGTNVTLSNGNLTASFNENNGIARSTIGKSTGKWYWELTVVSGTLYGGARPLSYVGLCTSALNMDSLIGTDASSFGVYEWDGALRYNNNESGFGTFWNINDVLGFAFDADAGTTQIFKNNVSMGTVNNALANLGSGVRYAAVSHWTTNICAVTANFGATALTYTPPSGYNSGLYNV